MAETHSIRNAVIATVLGGLILTFVLWLLDALRPATSAIWNSLSSVVDLLTGTIVVPVWVTLLALTGAIALIVLALNRRTNPAVTSSAKAGTSNPSLEDLPDNDKQMLSVLFAADGERVAVPTLTSVVEISRLEVESAMERLEKRGFVDVHYNYVSGTSWTLTSIGRDMLLSLKQRESV